MKRLMLLLACLFPFHASAEVFRTDTSWLVANSAPAAGWNTSAVFDESGFTAAAFVTYLDFGDGRGADGIWMPDPGYSWGEQFWFRKIINVAAPVKSAFLNILPDDDVTVYVNGSMVLNDANVWSEYHPGIDLTGTLHEGDNLIAMVVTDYYCCGVVAAQIDVTPVPEPEIYAMFLSGLGLLGMLARRRRHAA